MTNKEDWGDDPKHWHKDTVGSSKAGEVLIKKLEQASKNGGHCTLSLCETRDALKALHIADENTRAPQEPVDIEELNLIIDSFLHDIGKPYPKERKQVFRDFYKHLASQGYLTTPQDNSAALEYLDRVNYGWWADKEHPIGKTIRRALGGE